MVQDIPPHGVGLDAAETSLLIALRQGGEAAFETLVRTYGGRMLSVAKRFFTNIDDAQDAVQDAFLSAFKALPTFDGRSQLGTWLHRIVVNASLMKLRTLRRHPEQSIDHLLPQFLEDGHRRGFTRFRLDVSADNDAAIRLYQRIGFSIATESAIPGTPIRYYSMVMNCEAE